MTKENGKPQIRFAKFKDTWEQRKSGDIAPLRGGFAFKSNEYCSEGVPIVRISNILSDGSVGSDFAYYNEQNYDEVYTLYDGAAVLAMSGATTGKVSVLYAEKGQKYYQNQRVGYFVPTDTCEYSFIRTIMRSQLFADQLSAVLVAGAQPNVSSKEIDGFEFMIPKSKDEQRWIGEYFTNLDNLITLHQRKYDKLTKVKKSMLEKMFPKNGANVPEIRFNGFTDAWEQRKLGGIASSFEYGLNAAAKEYDGENKYIRITDIDDNTHEFLTDALTSPDINLTGAENYKLTEGDILFARTGASVGKSYIYKDSDGLVYYAGFLIRARIKEEYDAEFVFQNTLTDKYNKYIAVTSQRSGQPGVNAQEYSEFEIRVPEREEQTKIGTYFCHLDHLITLHQRKLEKLKILKKACLEKMFV